MTSPEAPVEIVSYDAAWPSRFEEECAQLRRVLTPWLAGPIEHIGSTAIAGLAAKPVIDIMAGVDSLDGSRLAIAAAARLGYCYFPYQAELKHWFCKPSPAFRTHHLHLIPHGAPLWHDRLKFRDALRADPALAADYAALKLDLAAKFKFDRDAYTDAKSTFIARILAVAG